MYTEKDKIDKDDIEQLNFEAELERWFEKILRLAV